MLIFSRESGRGQGGLETSSLAAAILFMAGLILSLVAATHILLIWIPAHFGSAPWEFTAVTQSIDVFPLAVTGFALLSCGAVVRGWRRSAIVLSLLCAVAVLALLALATLMVLDLVVAWASVTRVMRDNLFRAGGKALGFSAIFIVYYFWLGLQLKRFVRQTKPAR